MAPYLLPLSLSLDIYRATLGQRPAQFPPQIMETERKGRVAVRRGSRIGKRTSLRGMGRTARLLNYISCGTHWKIPAKGNKTPRTGSRSEWSEGRAAGERGERVTGGLSWKTCFGCDFEVGVSPNLIGSSAQMQQKGYSVRRYAPVARLSSLEHYQDHP